MKKRVEGDNKMIHEGSDACEASLVKKITQNGHPTVVGKNVDDSPADGGTRAWLVMLGSFFCNGILFGVINSYSVIYTELLHTFNDTSAGKAALPGAFVVGTTFAISPIAGVLTDLFGIRTTTFVGGAIATCGMLLSSFCVGNIPALCVTYGLMYGLGGSLAYTPSIAVLGHYFDKNLGLVNGIAAAGSSVFTIAMPYLIDVIMRRFGLVWTFRGLAVLASLLMGCAMLFKPVKTTRKVSFRDVFNVALAKNVKYVIWTSVIAVSLFGYFVPYIFMVEFVKSTFPKDVDNKLPILCIGIMSGTGRLVFGFVADRKNVDRIALQQMAFLVLGILTMLMPFASFPALIVISLGMGLVDGCFICLLGPIAFDICGRGQATQAIGFVLGVCSLPLTVGPYVAGILHDAAGSYTLPLILSGIPPIVGAVAMFAIRCVRVKPLAEGSEDSRQREKLTETGPGQAEDQL